MAAVTSRADQQYATCISPIMHLIGPSKFCISIVFNFSWDGCNTQKKWKTKVMQNFGGQGALWEMCKWRIAHLTVTGGNEDGVDLVLIQPFLSLLCKSCFSSANWYFLSKIYICKGRKFVSRQGQPQPHVHSKARILSTLKNYICKGRRFVSKQGQPQPHVHSKARILSTHWTVKWSIVHLWGYTRHSTGYFIRHPVISKMEKKYIYTLLFWRDSISRVFNFVISIGKYKKKGMEFRDSSILNFVLFPNSFSLLKFLDEVEQAKRIFKNSLHLDSVLRTWNLCRLLLFDNRRYRMEITSETSFNSTNIQIIKIICVFVGRILYMLLLFLVKHSFLWCEFS